MSTVYRIQCEDCGTGPYNCECAGWVQDKLYLRDSHSTDFFLSTRPGMMVDFPHGLHDDMELYHCGFSSVEQIFYWFSAEDLDMLRENGFKLAVYDVMPEDRVASKSSAQVFFRREYAMLMATREVPIALFRPDKRFAPRHA